MRGNLLISASREADIRVLDVSIGYCLKTISGHAAWIRDIDISIEGGLLLSCGHDM
ncbi:hypothetical protein BDW69DRAFT_168689, partial [Aspergillus filifer]